MGGNVKVGTWSAEPIDLEFIDQERENILGTMYAISREMQRRFNMLPFGDTHVNMNCFTGSSDLLMNANIPNDQFLRFKPQIGDVDMQMKYSCKYVFEDLLRKHPTFAGYTVRGFTKHGHEFSVLMQNMTFGETHQFDFQFVDEPGCVNERFLHSASWGDIQLGVKGAHHKILLNAVGMDTYKFSIINGLSRRDGEPPYKTRDAKGIQQKLFGDMSLYVDGKINSFIGVVDLIYRFTPQQHVLAIYEKFVRDARERVKDKEANDKAIFHFEEVLGLHA